MTLPAHQAVGGGGDGGGRERGRRRRRRRLSAQRRIGVLAPPGAGSDGDRQPTGHALSLPAEGAAGLVLGSSGRPPLFPRLSGAGGDDSSLKRTDQRPGMTDRLVRYGDRKRHWLVTKYTFFRPNIDNRHVFQ